MTREDFVLAVLAASNGAAHTPVQVQKLFFLLDKKAARLLGGPYFDFLPDNYGPFDCAVYRCLETLSGVNLVSIENVDDARRKTYRTTPEGQQQGEDSLADFAPEIRDYIRAVSDWVRKLSFAQLVSAIYAEYPDMKSKSIFRHAY